MEQRLRQYMSQKYTDCKDMKLDTINEWMLTYEY